MTESSHEGESAGAPASKAEAMAILADELAGITPGQVSAGDPQAGQAAADAPAMLEPEENSPALLAVDARTQSPFNQPGLLAGIGQLVMETAPVAITLRGLGKAFPALAHRDYRFMWMGAMCSNMGMWMETIAVQWLIKSLAPDSSALWLGRAAFAKQIPAAILLPIGGMIADRLDRRWIILTGNLCLAILSVVMMIIQWRGLMNIWLLLGAVTVIGTWDAMLKPANQSLLSTLIPKASLSNAVALNSVQFNLTRGIGPAVGGVVLVSLGATWSFGVNALSFATIIFAVLMIRRPEPEAAPASAKKKDGPMASLAGGVTYLRKRRDMQLLLAVVFSSSFLAVPLLFMLPAIVEVMYDDNAQEYSRLLSCFGLGAVVGVAMLAIRSHKHTSPWRGFITMGLFALMEVAISFGWPFHVAMAMMFCCGMTYISSLNRFFAGTIGSIPTHVRGRVSSLHMLSMLTGYPTGSLLAGWLASMFGIEVIMYAYGLTLIGILLLAGLVVWKFKLHFQDDTDGRLTQAPAA